MLVSSWTWLYIVANLLANDCTRPDLLAEKIFAYCISLLKCNCTFSLFILVGIQSCLGSHVTLPPYLPSTVYLVLSRSLFLLYFFSLRLKNVLNIPHLIHTPSTGACKSNAICYTYDVQLLRNARHCVSITTNICAFKTSATSVMLEWNIYLVADVTARLISGLFSCMSTSVFDFEK